MESALGEVEVLPHEELAGVVEVPTEEGYGDHADDHAGHRRTTSGADGHRGPEAALPGRTATPPRGSRGLPRTLVDDGATGKAQVVAHSEEDSADGPQLYSHRKADRDHVEPGARRRTRAAPGTAGRHVVRRRVSTGPVGNEQCPRGEAR